MSKLEKLINKEKRIKFKSLFLCVFLSYYVYAENNFLIKLKCNSGANPGQIKRWYFDEKDVIEIYPNGYKRVYDVRKMGKYEIYANEDAVQGMYYVRIHLYEDEMKVEVITPLATYVDSSCKKLN